MYNNNLSILNAHMAFTLIVADTCKLMKTFHQRGEKMMKTL